MSNKFKKIGKGTYSEVYYDRQSAIKMYKSNITKSGITDDCLKDIVIYKHYLGLEVEGVSIENNKVYLFMRYYGINLHRLKNPTLLDMKNIFFSVGVELKKLHYNGIIHRDIKPENILYNDGINCKLIDNSISSLSSYICYGRPVYTEWYRAPEIFVESSPDTMKMSYLSVGPYTKSADLWALGIILLEYAVDHIILPFQRDQRLLEFKTFYQQLDKYLETFSEILYGNYVKYFRSARKRDPIMFDLITKLVSKNPEERLNIDEYLMHPWFKTLADSNANTPMDIPKKENHKITYQLINRELKGDILNISRRIKKYYNRLITEEYDQYIDIVVNSLYIVYSYLSTQPDMHDKRELTDSSLDITVKLLLDNYQYISTKVKYNYLIEIDILKELDANLVLSADKDTYYQYLFNPDYWLTGKERQLFEQDVPSELVYLLRK